VDSGQSRSFDNVMVVVLTRVRLNGYGDLCLQLCQWQAHGGPTLAKKNNAIKVKIETGKHLCQIDPFN